MGGHCTAYEAAMNRDAKGKNRSRTFFFKKERESKKRETSPLVKDCRNMAKQEFDMSCDKVRTRLYKCFQTSHGYVLELSELRLRAKSWHTILYHRTSFQAQSRTAHGMSASSGYRERLEKNID